MATKIKILIGILVIILLIIGGWWTWNQLTCKGICYGNKIKSCRPIGFKCLCEEFLTCSKKCGAECETGEDCREGEICDVENCKCITGEVVDSFTDETKIASKENLIIDITSGEVKLRIAKTISVDAGKVHTCTVLSDGAVKCWGRNNDGQLGDGTNEMRPLPVSVFGITDAISVSAESMHTCINSSVGTVKCWGYNAYGELGYGITADINKPVSVINLGILTSANLLSGRNVGSIDSFNYNSSFISPGCGLKVQFSQNNIDWYDSLGNINNWNNLSQGEHVINLSSLNWSGPDFYYRLKFESDFSCVPVLNEIIMKYHFPTY